MAKKVKLMIIILFIIIMRLSLRPFSNIAFSSPFTTKDCLLCHRYTNLACFEKNTGSKKTLSINEDFFLNTVHSKLNCIECHCDIKEIPHQSAKPVDCGIKCHLKDPASEKDFSHEPIVTAFSQGIHASKDGRLLSPFINDGGPPKCKYCHQNPLYLSSTRIRKDMEQRCKECHPQKGWINQFMKHFLSRENPRWNNKEIVGLCNNCHANKELMAKYGVPSTAEFKKSHHFNNIKFETSNAAHCLNCHAPSKLGFSPHQLQSPKDPNSPLGQNKRLATCAQADCHSQANKAFTLGAIHSPEKKETLLKEKLENPEEELSTSEKSFLLNEIKQIRKENTKWMVIKWVKFFYKILILLIGGFMIVHQALDIRRSIIEEKTKEKKIHQKSSQEIFFQRLRREEIWQHNLLAVSFILLAISGMMVLIPAQWITLLFGPYSATIYSIRRFAHITFAGILLFTGIWHLIYISFFPHGRKIVLDMLPGKNDLIHLWRNFLYFIGIEQHPPKFDRFNYQEKLEYITGGIGMVIISATGVIMLFSTYFPKFWVDLAWTVHLMEALLASIAIAVWHLFSVHWKPGKFPMDSTWLDGKITLEALMEEHPLQYDRIIKESSLYPDVQTAKENISGT